MSDISKVFELDDILRVLRDIWNDQFICWTVFHPDLRPADNSLVFDLRRPILSLKMWFSAQFQSRFFGIVTRFQIFGLV